MNDRVAISLILVVLVAALATIVKHADKIDHYSVYAEKDTALDSALDSAKQMLNEAYGHCLSIAASRGLSGDSVCLAKAFNK